MIDGARCVRVATITTASTGVGPDRTYSGGPDMPPIENVRSSGSGTVRPARVDGPTSPEAPAPMPPPIDPDSFNPRSVKRAEELLKRLGHKPGVVDRTYTQNTQAAVMSFQQAVGLDPTGNLDTRTMNALRRAAKQKNRGVMGPGQASERIKTIEKRLKRLGHDPGQIDGVYDQDTARAVHRFKRDQGMKGAHVKRGLLGKEGRQELHREVQHLNHRVYSARVKPSTERRQDDARVERATQQGRVLERGDSNRAVKVVQGHLRAAGFNTHHKNGIFDDRTEGMVR